MKWRNRRTHGLPGPSARPARRAFAAEPLESRTLLSGVSGMVFDDVNRDGVYNGSDIPIPGRTVWVDLDNDAVLDAGEPSGVTSGTQGPNPFGNYKIEGLANGA